MLKLGTLELDAPFIQAALSGYSDLPMRKLARRFGAPFTLNEVILDQSVLQKSRKQHRFQTVPDDHHPVGGQLMGAEPEMFGSAAIALAQAGYDLIDINFGCPVKKVLGRCRGGHLLSDPETALSIVARVLDAVGSTRPVTVKMRRGSDDTIESEKNFFAILDGAFELGVAAVTVHGRSVVQRYVGPSNWPFLARVKRHVGGRVILGSGDLFSAEACLRMLEQTGVDGVTIARGCIGNPWIFQECRELLAGNPLPPPPTIAQQGEAIAGHWADVAQFYGEEKGAKIMRKFGIKYSEHHPQAMEVRNAFIGAKHSGDVERVLSEWYDPNRDWPPVLRRTSHGDLVAAGASS